MRIHICPCGREFLCADPATCKKPTRTKCKVCVYIVK